MNHGGLQTIYSTVLRHFGPNFEVQINVSFGKSSRRMQVCGLTIILYNYLEVTSFLGA